MEAWESSGQWGFSCYSNFKNTLSGFADLSPEELRLEYYTTRASGDLQSYVSGVTQMLNQWRSRLQELRSMAPATRVALLAELNNQTSQASSSSFGSASSSGFGSAAPGFGGKGFGAADQASTFSFASPAAGFGSSAAPTASAGFGSAASAPAPPPSGFGAAAPSASSFSFATSTADKPAAASTGFGSASGFSFASTGNAGGFGSGFGSQAPAAAGSGGLFAQTSGGASAAAGGGTMNPLFSSKGELSEDELAHFQAKRFTLGQIPLKPPPADMLVV